MSDFKTQLRDLCMKMDLDLGSDELNTPFGDTEELRGLTVYRYYLVNDLKVSDDLFIKEVEKYEDEYEKNKKVVIYKEQEN